MGGREPQVRYHEADAKCAEEKVAVISAIPILLLFFFLKRYIVGGLTDGLVKG